VGEKPWVLAGDAFPACVGFLEGSQSFVFLADPAHQVGVDALQEGIQRGAVERSIVLHPAADDWIDTSRDLGDGDLTRILADNRVVIPTLAMMRGLADPLGRPPGAYTASARGLGVLHAAGVPILAGTDANATPGVPYQPAFGASLHQELALLVNAGLSTAAALRAAAMRR
jgi:hypothetical protein